MEQSHGDGEQKRRTQTGQGWGSNRPRARVPCAITARSLHGFFHARESTLYTIGLRHRPASSASPVSLGPAAGLCISWPLH